MSGGSNVDTDGDIGAPDDDVSAALPMALVLPVEVPALEGKGPSAKSNLGMREHPKERSCVHCSMEMM